MSQTHPEASGPVTFKRSEPYAAANMCLIGGLMFTVAFFTNEGPLTLFAKADELGGFLISFVVYLGVLYFFEYRQGFGALVNPHMKDSEDKTWKQHKLNLDRTPGNALEQATLVMPTVLLYAFLVKPVAASALMSVYIAFLLLYPMLYGKGLWIFASTVPRYYIVFYMACSVAVCAGRS